MGVGCEVGRGKFLWVIEVPCGLGVGLGTCMQGML